MIFNIEKRKRKVRVLACCVGDNTFLSKSFAGICTNTISAFLQSLQNFI